MHAVADLLGPHRTSSTAALSAAVSPRTLTRWLATGRLVRLHPGWVTAPEFADDWTVRAHAATGYTGGPLSHVSALAVHGLAEEATRLHVTVPAGFRVRSSRWLRVHRTTRSPAIVIARGLPVTPLPRTLVETWGQAHAAGAVRTFPDVVRQAILAAVRDRRIAPGELIEELASVSRLPARGALRELTGLVASGSHSELEIFGALHVLDVPGLPPCRKQYRMLLPDGPVRLDAAWPEVKLAVELDGAAFHSGPDDWERDLRRDAALAALGWLVLRFSHRRITREPAACRAQIAQVYRQRAEVLP